MGRPLGPGMLSKAFTDGVRGCWSLYCSKDFSKVSCPLCNGHFTSHINSNIYLNGFFKTGCFSVTKYNFCYNWCYWMFYSISQVLASMNLAIIKILKTLLLRICVLHFFIKCYKYSTKMIKWSHKPFHFYVFNTPNANLFLKCQVWPL